VSSNSLILPFLDDSPAYAHGVELGMLFARMKTEATIEDYFLRDNQEQITLAANRLGWRVLEMRLGPCGWFWCQMKREEVNR
jgi:hypothetical protein